MAKACGLGGIFARKKKNGPDKRKTPPNIHMMAGVFESGPSREYFDLLMEARTRKPANPKAAHPNNPKDL